ncbi:hypothetical protein [Streptobacillus canis]|uniref:hypothetical protein n=1 Tax=Streptobacillus canis TaxID=2678686 RepID=UPI0018CBF982|nr:hypothetical protein [Streptobacillus canis]
MAIGVENSIKKELNENSKDFRTTKFSKKLLAKSFKKEAINEKTGKIISILRIFLILIRLENIKVLWYIT